MTSGADGIYESQLYPVKSGSPGNWGTINVGVSNNSTSTLGAQIRYGITPASSPSFPTARSLSTPPIPRRSPSAAIPASVRESRTT